MEGRRRSVSWRGVLPSKILRWCTLLSFEMHSIWDNVIVSYSFMETSSDQKELNFAVERSGSIFQKNNRHVVGVNNRIRMEGGKLNSRTPEKLYFGILEKCLHHCRYRQHHLLPILMDVASSAAQRKRPCFRWYQCQIVGTSCLGK